MRTVIYGPPGTGKSTKLLGLMKEHVESGTPVGKIGLVSFTKSAAHELATRAGIKPGGNISTMHSYAFRLAGISRDQVVGPAHLADLSKRIGIEVTGRISKDGESFSKEGDFYLALEAYHRATLGTDIVETYDASPRLGTLSKFRLFCESYPIWKKSHGYVDFQDMLDLALIEEAPDLDVLFVDEAQDLSASQWKLLDHWAKTIPTIYVAGDDDQAIYEWSGAHVHGMFEFEEKHNAHRHVLSQSYRVPVAVFNHANKLLGIVKKRVPKEYKPTANTGTINRRMSLTASDLDLSEQTFILYRTHSARKKTEETIRRLGVPYWGGSSPLGREGAPSRVVRAISVFYKLKDNLAHMNQVMLTPTESKLLADHLAGSVRKALSEGQYEYFINHAWWECFSPRDLETFKYLRLMDRFWGGRPDKIVPFIQLMTIHESKGKEADHVVLINEITKRVHDGFITNPDQEVRTMYVASTRSKNKLTIILGENGFGWV